MRRLMSTTHTGTPVNSPRQVLFASLIGTTIEFFDFYIYATAAVLVFPRLFFPQARTRRRPRSSRWRPLASRFWRGRSALLCSVTLAIASAARPRWSWHCRPWAYPQSPSERCQPTERLASPRRCCWRCAASARGWVWEASGAAPCCWPLRMRLRTSARGTACFRSSARRPVSCFPGALSCCSRVWLTDQQFFAFGWRLPFLASAVLVFLGLYVRLTITETPVFREALEPGRAGEGADAGGFS